MPPRKSTTAHKLGRKPSRVFSVDKTVVVAFRGDIPAPLALPDYKKLPFDDGEVPNEAIRGQRAWLDEHVHSRGPPERKRIVFGVLFIFPDDPDAMGQLDPNFTCRAQHGMMHYIMHQYSWPQEVKWMFPDGAVRFHEICVLDHNNVVVSPALYDAMFLDLARLDRPPLQRTPINLTVLCYKFGMRTTNVSIAQVTPGAAGTERVTFVSPVSHQTFSQLCYGIHKRANRLAAFFTDGDTLTITETLLNGGTHRVTAETYGTCIYDPAALMHAELRC